MSTPVSPHSAFFSPAPDRPDAMSGDGLQKLLEGVASTDPDRSDPSDFATTLARLTSASTSSPAAPTQQPSSENDGEPQDVRTWHDVEGGLADGTAQSPAPNSPVVVADAADRTTVEGQIPSDAAGSTAPGTIRHTPETLDESGGSDNGAGTPEHPDEEDTGITPKAVPQPVAGEQPLAPVATQQSISEQDGPARPSAADGGTELRPTGEVERSARVIEQPAGTDLQDTKSVTTAATSPVRAASSGEATPTTGLPTSDSTDDGTPASRPEMTTPSPATMAESLRQTAAVATEETAPSVSQTAEPSRGESASPGQPSASSSQSAEARTATPQASGALPAESQGQQATDQAYRGGNQTASDRPGRHQPDSSQTASSQFVSSEPAGNQSIRNQPGSNPPVSPQTAGGQAVDSQAVGVSRIEPQSHESNSIQPQATPSESVQSQSDQSHSAQTQRSQSQLAQSQLVQPQLARAQLGQPQLGQSQAAQPQGAQSQPGEPVPVDVAATDMRLRPDRRLSGAERSGDETTPIADTTTSDVAFRGPGRDASMRRSGFSAGTFDSSNATPWRTTGPAHGTATAEPLPPGSEAAPATGTSPGTGGGSGMGTGADAGGSDQPTPEHVASGGQGPALPAGAMAGVAAHQTAGGTAVSADPGVTLEPAVQQHLTEQVVASALERARIVQQEGQARMELQLSPPELGRMRIEISRSERGLKMRVSAESPATAMMLRSSLGEIQTRLESGEMPIESMEILDGEPGGDSGASDRSPDETFDTFDIPRRYGQTGQGASDAGPAATQTGRVDVKA